MFQGIETRAGKFVNFKNLQLMGMSESSVRDEICTKGNLEICLIKSFESLEFSGRI